jgi:lipopolysaccharide biosynthesis regulator YciM
MRAGLLDRAETLFADLVAMDALAPSALRHLIGIYQHERDWDKAIEHARRLERATGESQATTIAQFHCELAEQARAQGDQAARAHIADAFAVEADCVRAGMILGNLESSENHLDAAIAAFERVAELDVDYLPKFFRLCSTVTRARSRCSAPRNSCCASSNAIVASRPCSRSHACTRRRVARTRPSNSSTRACANGRRCAP